jgi:hypothetical protein
VRNVVQEKHKQSRVALVSQLLTVAGGRFQGARRQAADVVGAFVVRRVQDARFGEWMPALRRVIGRHNGDINSFSNTRPAAHPMSRQAPQSPTRLARSKILEHLRKLRERLSQARDALMHYSGDRVDRDKLEPAARRVDDLINMFASEVRDPAQSSAWVAEIQSGIEQVTNPKAAAALQEARADLAALLTVMETKDSALKSKAH